jgi:hypothetical protein
VVDQSGHCLDLLRQVNAEWVVSFRSSVVMETVVFVSDKAQHLALPLPYRVSDMAVGHVHVSAVSFDGHVVMLVRSVCQLGSR